MFTSLSAAAALPTARLWLLALAFIAFAAFAGFSAGQRYGVVNATVPARSQAPEFARPLAPTVYPDGSCGNGAYVTGDMSGDASPASIYEALCPR